jgi:HK97 family phage major capsid protein
LHTEGGTITASADTLITVSLAGFEINKLITISKTVATMSINAFETWLTDMLAEAIANKISSYLISGTGSSQPTGIEKAQTWGASNSVTVTLAGSLSAANVQTLCGLLPGGYDNGAKFLMSKKTLFTDFMPLQDTSKNAIVTKEGANYYVYGYPVMFDERVTFHEAFLGNYKKAIVGNLAESVNVQSAFDIKTNSFDYLGSAIFDSKVAIGEAVVKLVKATS